MAIHLLVDRRDFEATELPSDDQLQLWASAALATTGNEDTSTDYELSIAFQTAIDMAATNKEYRAVDAPTNVLSFPSEMPSLPSDQQRSLRPLGDIVLCPDVIELEAISQRKPNMHHYSHLIIHGVLHVLGYDHESDSDAKTMESLEIQILSGLGIANPYIESTNEVSNLN